MTVRKGAWSAPGRVNIIGEHTDYSGGFALPFALAQRAVVHARLRDDDRITARSDGHGEVEFPVATTPGEVTGWGAHVAGVAWALARTGAALMGADPRIHSAVPSGADLSSSHSLECAAALALAGLHELDLSRAELVRLVQHAENDYVGEPDRAILVDSRHLTAEPVPCEFAAVGLDLVWSTPGHGTGMRTASTAPVVPPASRRQRPSGSATSATWSTSTTRSLASPTRSPCGGAATSSARTLGSSTPSSCSVRDGCARSARCSRRRTRRSATTTRPPSPSSTWPSRPLSARGALGARMIGGGFGGSVIAPVDQADRRTVEVAVEDAFRQRGFGKPEFHLGRPSRGAGRDR